MSTDNFFYFSREKTGGWIAAPAVQRANVINDKQPKYVTVLNLSQLVEDDTPVEEQQKVRYSGPFYADWDCENIEDGAASVNRFLDLLETEYEVNIECIAIYATGGRGYHIELPFETFCGSTTLKNSGVQFLPQIYKEIANELFVEDMDLAIYSGKRGRMWRTPNIERETPGRYKVPISLQQMRDMTAELYTTLTEEIQPFPALSDPVYSPQLGAKFDDFKKKVEQRYREAKKRGGDNKQALKSFAGEWPQSALTLMDGENLSSEHGLNKIALQLGILSAGLGKTLEQHIDACDGLIKTYRGDGHTTRREVRNELKRMFRYVEDNPAYGFSAGGLRSIMDDGDAATDLSTDTRGTKSKRAGDLTDLAGGLVNGTDGIYSSKDDRLHRETNWHFKPGTATQMIDVESEMVCGYVVESMNNGNIAVEDIINPSEMTSPDAMKRFFAAHDAVAPKLDAYKTGGIMAAIMQGARNNSRVFALSKEGFNLVWRDGEQHLVWASPEGCYAASPDVTYRYRSSSGSEMGNFNTDLATSDKLDSHANVASVIDALLHFNNNDFTVAAVLGWLCACWHKVLHHKYGSSFPLLELYGESGAGKTSMMLVLMKMFYNRVDPKMQSASSGTAFGRRTMLSSSSTIPYFIDEFKPNSMAIDQVREMRMLIHEMYTPSFQAPRGGGNAGRAKNGWADLSFDSKTTPMLFSTETPETATAIQERTIAAPFSKRAREGRARDAFNLLRRNSGVLSSLGKSMMQATFVAKPEVLKKIIEDSHAAAEETLDMTGNSRIVYNSGVAISGLKFLGMVLRHCLKADFESKFMDRLIVLQQALTTPDNYVSLQAAPELVKMLRFMITISHQDAPDSDYVPKLGSEFTYTDKSLDLDINIDAFFGRYKVACQRRSHVPSFPDVDAFLMAMESSSMSMGSQPTDSKLILSAPDGAMPRVVRLDEAQLRDYKIGYFRMK